MIKEINKPNKLFEIAENSIFDLVQTQNLIEENIRFLKAIFVEYFTGAREESSTYLYEHMDIMLNTAINEIERTNENISKKIETNKKLLQENSTFL